MADLTIDQQQYESLIALAREGTKLADGTVDSEKALRLDNFLRLIEEQNGITRDALWVQWQDSTTPLPVGTKFPEKWPPDMRYYIELVTRKVSKADVEQVLEAHANSPTNVLVTSDPGARVGWTPLDQYFLTG